MAQVQDEATISNFRAIHEYRNKKRNTYRPDETETQIKKAKSETTRLNHQSAERSEIH